jgi:hypothetical protein
VRITGSGDDARARIVSVTRNGRAKLAVALPAWRIAQSAAIAAIGDSGAVALRGLSDRSIG